MRRPVLCALIAVFTFTSLGIADERVDRLPPEYKKWLEEEVVYIITDVERDIFLDLTTREERDLFIQAFWDRRDPDPATAENEFKTEHYARIEYANRVLGREATRPGWKTDRGKFWIILGKPHEIQRYDGYNEVVATEIWFYQGDTSLGLPARFNLTFFREGDFGEYQLYDPFSDGPERLVRTGYASQYYQVNQNLAVDVLEGVSMDLARASMTVDLTELSSSFLAARNSIDPLELRVRPSMNIQRTLADIETSPLRRVNTKDLEGYREFGHLVTSDYSFRFFESRSMVAVLYDEDNTPFIHYALEIDPEKFTLERDDDGNRYYTTLEVSVEVRDADGRTIAYGVNEPLLQMSAAEFETAGHFPFGYRDNYPVISGDYTVSVVLKNRATKEYTAAEFKVSVPEIEPGKPALSDVVLGYDRDTPFGKDNKLHKTFEVGPTQIYPTTDQTFSLDSSAYALVQVLEAEPGSRVRLRIMKDGEKFHEAFAVPVDGIVEEEVPLLGLEGGFYKLTADLMSPSGEVLASREAPLVLTPKTTVPRPAFVYRHSFNVDVEGWRDFTLGNELMAAGRIEEAKAKLEAAVAVNNPALPMARWRLASVVLFSADADRALELLQPLEQDHPNEYEVVEGLGFAYYIKKDYERAKGYFERSAKIKAPDTTALNALGDCYERLGDTDKAKELYKRSLEMDPSQKGVQARLAQLTGGA